MGKLLNKFRILLPVLTVMLAGLVFLPGCKVSKKVSRTKIMARPFGEVFHAMEKQQASFQYLRMKLGVTVHTDTKASTGVKAQLRIKSDSLIWCSIVPAMGIEVARVQIAHDSIKLINRMKKNYVTGSYQLLDSLLHATVSYRGLEALMLAKPLFTSNHQEGYARVDGAFYQLQLNDSVEKHTPDTNLSGLQQTLWVDPHTFLIKKMLVKNPDNPGRSIQVFYDTYMQVDGKYFPSSIKIFIFAKKNMQIDIAARKLELVNALSFPFNIPRNYVKL